MKKLLFLLPAVLMVILSCVGGPATKDEPKTLVKKPDLLDHKNFKWGKDVPDWVTMDTAEIQKGDAYKDAYVFKFESPRGENLLGVEVWAKKFVVGSAMADQFNMRIQSKFAGAAAGDMDAIETYMEQVVKVLSQADVSGLRPIDDYWVQMRYYTPEGKVDQDAYTYVLLYAVDKQEFDRQVNNAIDGVKPRSEEETTARDRVREAISEGF